MDKNKMLKRIFELAHDGIYIDINTLPDGISKNVVYKNLLYIELQNLLKKGENKERIEEIQSILNSQREGAYE